MRALALLGALVIAGCASEEDEHRQQTIHEAKLVLRHEWLRHREVPDAWTDRLETCLDNVEMEDPE